jgi:hypothetical protein
MKNIAISILALLTLASAILLVDCARPSPVPTPPPVNATDAPVIPVDPVQPVSFQQLCDKLAAIGCLEGASTDCARTFDLNAGNAASVADLNVDCLYKADDVDAVRACGSVECKILPGAKASKCSLACSNLKRLGCKEAVGCLAACIKNQQSTVADMKLDCLSAAKTQAGVRKCGTATCPP